jgi:hypothetical protein
VFLRIILQCAASAALGACTASFSERRESLDDASNPRAPEAIVRTLPPTLEVWDGDDGHPPPVMHQHGSTTDGGTP